MVEFVNQIKLYPLRFVKTCALYTALIGVGFSLGVVGPTLLDLKTQVGRGLSDVSYALPARAGGYALGSFVMAFSYERMNFMLSASISLAIATVLTASMPHIHELYSLLAVFLLSGGALGFLETGAHMHLLHLWGKENPPFMQALQLCYGVGALIVPLVAEPFLLLSDLDDDGDEKYVNPADLQLVYPYSIVAGVLAFSSIFFFLLWRFYPYTEEHPSRKQHSSPKKDHGNDSDKNNTSEAVVASVVASVIALSSSNQTSDNNITETIVEGNQRMNEQSQQQRHSIVSISSNAIPYVVKNNCKVGTHRKESSKEEDETRKQHKIYKGVVIILTVMFMHIYYGLEITFGSYLTTFAVESNLKLTKSVGAHMTSLFWGTFTFFRLFAVFYIEYVGSEINIFINLMVVLLANAFLIPFGNSNELYLWIGVGMIGIGTSSIWAAVFGYLEEYFPVTSRIASAIIVSAMVGEFGFPLIISNFIEDTPTVFLWVTLFCSVSITLIFILMILVMRCKMKILNRALGLTPNPSNEEAAHH